MPPWIQGLILGMLTASLVLIAVIVLWLKLSTTESATMQTSTGKLLFCLNNPQKSDKFLTKSNCPYFLPYAQIE
jgi:hypothetical protein